MLQFAPQWTVVTWKYHDLAKESKIENFNMTSFFEIDISILLFPVKFKENILQLLKSWLALVWILKVVKH